VDVGGFGLAVGSLANLIALRLLRKRRAWLAFHGYSLPFLIAAGALAWLWLFAA
jgi:di/tricarboxylate transporter